MKNEYNEFKKWFKKQEIRFHQGQYDDMQIAYAGYCYAQERAKTLNLTDIIGSLPHSEDVKEMALKYRPQQDKLGEFWRDGFNECYSWLVNRVDKSK